MFRMNRIGWTVAGSLLLLAPSLATPAAASTWDAGQDTLPTLEQILERHVVAVGGRDAIARLTTRVMKGRLVTDLPTREPPVHESNGFEFYSKTPGKYRFIQQSAWGVSRGGFRATQS